jgi:hypothetical protein
MAVGFTTWTVLDNKPIDKLEENLWHISGRMPGGNERKMVVARRGDGDLVIFNAIALAEPAMAELEAFGRPAYMVVPNAFHRQDAFIWKQRYPGIKVVAPRGARKAVAKAAPVELHCDEVPADDRVQVTHPQGLADREALMIVRHGAGQTLVACDALLNMASRDVKFPFSFLLAPLDTLSTPRAIRWMMLRDRAAWVRHLEQLAGTITRIIPGHGAIIEKDAAGALRGAAARLR